MTVEDIADFVSQRGYGFSKKDMAKLNEMLFELPLEQITDVQAWVHESLWLKVSDPQYTGDLELDDGETEEGDK